MSDYKLEEDWRYGKTDKEIFENKKSREEVRKLIFECLKEEKGLNYVPVIKIANYVKSINCNGVLSNLEMNGYLEKKTCKDRWPNDY